MADSGAPPGENLTLAQIAAQQTAAMQAMQGRGRGRGRGRGGDPKPKKLTKAQIAAQERAAAVLADLARSGDNKKAIVEAGGVNPLVAMLSSPSEQVKISAAGAVSRLGLITGIRQKSRVSQNSSIVAIDLFL